jgi:hypothetical protein
MSDTQQASGLTSDTLAKQRDESATELVKALLIINGGGAVALLAFLQATWSSAPDLAKPTLLGIAVLSSLGTRGRSCQSERRQSGPKTRRTLWYSIRLGGELPASIPFRGDLYLLFERGDIVRGHCRTWKDRDSGEVIHANGERWLTKTQRPKRIALHSTGSS